MKDLFNEPIELYFLVFKNISDLKTFSKKVRIKLLSCIDINKKVNFISDFGSEEIEDEMDFEYRHDEPFDIMNECAYTGQNKYLWKIIF